MANRTTYTRLGIAESGVHARPVSPRQVSEGELDEGAAHPLDETATTGRRSLPAEILPPEPEGTTPLLSVEKSRPPTLDAPRLVTASNDTATAFEDGAPVVISVLNNDVGVAAVARINGVAVTPGSIITLASGARVIVNVNGTLSYEVGAGFQSLGAGQTAQDSFTYAAGDGGASSLAPDGAFNVSAINGTNGFVIQGAAAGDRSGYSVAGIGDINGDGHDDLLIGALSADLTGRVDVGVSYVVYGRQGGFGASLDLASLTAAQGFAITGVNAFDYSGASVRAAGDVNGDGLADFLIGAPWGEATQGTNAGESYLVFGRAGGFGAGLDLATLNGTTGVTFRGGAAGDGLGFAVSSAGDINGDGFDDLILGAREANGGGRMDAGASYVVFGRAGGFAAGIDVAGLTGTDGFAILGADASDRSGYSVAAAGDVNGDGIDDLIIGAPQGDPGGRANAGEAYVVFGRTGGFGAALDLGTLNGTNGFTISGVDAGDNAGWSVASAGDLNGDGLADLVIGALYADPGGRDNAGETYVVFGRPGGFGANLDLSSMPASMGFTITGSAALNLTGHSVASAGDINGDGFDDLLIGALYADGTGGVDAGETYVVFGRASGFTGVLDLSSLNGQTGFAIGGAAAEDFSGFSVSAAGDVNSDGFDDLIIGAPQADPSGRANAGSSYVLFGGANVTRTSNDATVTVTVTGVNDAPVITSNGGGATGTVTVTENGTAVATVTSTDADAGAQRTYAITGGADAARFVIDPATGVLTFVAAPNFEAPLDQNGDNVYEVVVQASDGLLVDTQTLAVTVTNQNEAPAITSNGGGATGGYTISENTTGPNTVTAADPDAGTTLTYTIIGGADAALFTINSSGVISLINPPNFEAPADQNGDNIYEVIVQASDGTLTDTQTINLTVTNANEAPVITSGSGGPSTSVTSLENGTTVTTVVATDPDARASLAFSVLSGRDGARFAIDPATGVLTFIAAPDFEAPTDLDGNNVYEVDVQVSDGLGGTDVQTIFVNVGNVNEAPVITSNGGGATGTVTVTENGTAVTTVTSVDPDAGAQRTYAITGGADAARFVIDPATGVLTFVAAPNFEAPSDQNGDNVYEVVVQASDGSLVDTQTLAVTVTNQNEAPVITSNGGGATGGYTISENTTGPNTVIAADPDAGTTLTYTIIGGADSALFTINASGVISLINPPDFEAPADQNGDNIYEVVVQASDGTLTDTQTISVTVTDVMEGTSPVLTDLASSVTFAENLVNAGAQLLDSVVTFTDAENDFNGGSLTVSGALAEDRISVRNEGSGTGQIGLSASSSVTFGGVVIGTLTGGTGATLTITFNASATSAAIDALIQNLTYANVSDTPTANRTLVINVTDAAGNNLGNGQSVAVTVTAENDIPKATGLPTDVTVTEDVASNLNLSAVTLTDADTTGSITVVLTASAGTMAASSGGSVTVTNSGTGAITLSGTAANIDAYLNTASNIQYTGALNANGDNAATVTVTANDGSGAVTLGTVNVDITAVNDAPVAADVTRNAGFSAGMPLAIGGQGQPLQAIFSLLDTNGDGRVETAGSIAGLGTAFGNGYGIASGDIDGDGDVDIAIAGSSGTYVFTNRGDTNGDGIAEFTGVQVYSGFVGYDVALGDLNGDGRLDLVSSQGGTLIEMINLGDSNTNGVIDNFSVRSVTDGATGGQTYGITIADMDGDGRMDILQANWSNGPTEIRFNLGDTNDDGQIDYRVQTIEDNFDEISLGVATGDIDGDGDLDFVLSRWNTENEVVYLNNGDTNGDGLLEFSTIELATGGATLESELIDIDRDGDLDIVSTEVNGAARIIYNQGDTNNDGLPDFVIQNIVGASSSYGLAVGDVDGDGDLDIVFAGAYGGSSILMENRGDTDGNGQLDFTRTALVGVSSSWDAEFVRIGGGTGAFEDGQAITVAFAGDDVDSDDDGASLTYTITSAPAEGTVDNNGNGTFSFSPGSGFQDLGRGQTRTVTFTYTATDSHGVVSSPATVTLAVAGTNDAPTAAALPTDVTVTQGAASNLNLSAVTLADVDTTGSITVVLTASAGTMTASSGGSVTVTNSGTAAITLTGTVANIDAYLNTASNIQYTSTPNANGNNAATVTVTANDGFGTVTLGIVNVDISGAAFPVNPSDDGGAPSQTKGGGPEVCRGPNDVDGGQAGTQPVPGEKGQSGGPQILPGTSDVSGVDKASGDPVVLPGAFDDLAIDVRAASDRSINRDGDPSLTVMDDGGILGDPDGSFDFGLGDADADVFVLTGEIVDTPLVLPREAGVDRYDIGALSDLFTGRDGDLPLTVMDDGTTFGGSYGFGSTLNFEVQTLGDDGFLLKGDLVDQPLVLPGETTGDAFGLDPMSDLFTALAGDSPLTVTEDGQILGGEPWIDTSGLYNWA